MLEWSLTLRTTWLAAATAFFGSLMLTPLVRRLAVRYGYVSKPVEDRWGRRRIARLGGVAMFGGLVIATLCWVPLEPTTLGLLFGLALVMGLGLVDDFRRMPPYTKLVAQLLIGTVVVISGVRVSLMRWAWLSIPLSVLWFVTVMNAFNLLDNMDGLAAGIGAIAAGFCAIHAGLANQWTIATLAAIFSGACLGFLRYNFPPAKIFMGDSGSHLLGLGLAGLALMGSWQHSTQLLSVLAIPTLVLAVPIFDTCFVTIQRLMHRRHPFVGGQDHVSHRLAVLGLSEQQTVMVLYVISATLGLLSVVSATLKPLPTFAIWVSVSTGLALFGRYLAKVNVYRLEQRPPGGKPISLTRPLTRIETMLFHKRRLLEILIDFCLIGSVYVFAYLLRFEGGLTDKLQGLIVKSLPVVLVIKLSCFAAYGLYRGVWRYVGLSDLLGIFKAVTIGSMLSALVLLYAWRFEGFSRAVLIIDWMLCLLAIGGSRVVERLLDEWISGASPQDRDIVLIIGAGDTGAHVLRSLKYSSQEKWLVAGFLDDDERKLGDRILGVPVLGGRHRLPQVLDEFQAHEVWIAITDPPGELLGHIRACCESRGVSWKVVTAGVADAV